MKTVLVILEVILGVVLFPVFTIWSLNMLFGLGIPYNLVTWTASWWLTMCLAADQFGKLSNQIEKLILKIKE